MLTVGAGVVWQDRGRIAQGAVQYRCCAPAARGEASAEVRWRTPGEHYPGSEDISRLRGEWRCGVIRPVPRELRQASTIRRTGGVERMIAAYRARGDSAAALALVSDHAARNPADGRALSLFATMLAENGDRLRAAAVLAHVGERGDPVLLAELARIQLATGHTDHARAAAASYGCSAPTVSWTRSARTLERQQRQAAG